MKTSLKLKGQKLTLVFCLINVFIMCPDLGSQILVAGKKSVGTWLCLFRCKCYLHKVFLVDNDYGENDLFSVVWL